MEIIIALPSDHLELTALTKLSKAHWGYGPGQIENWSDVLTITEDFISSNSVYKLSEEGKIFGYYAYILDDSISVTLDSLFIHPDHIGKGFGKLLMDDFLKRIESEGMKNIFLEADPNATAFYQRYGFIAIDKKLSSIPGRYLPIMKKEL